MLVLVVMEVLEVHPLPLMEQLEDHLEFKEEVMEKVVLLLFCKVVVEVVGHMICQHRILEELPLEQKEMVADLEVVDRHLLIKVAAAVAVPQDIVVMEEQEDLVEPLTLVDLMDLVVAVAAVVVAHLVYLEAAAVESVF